jgi:hypothetical protein
MPQQDGLNLSGVHILPTALDHVLQPTHQPQVALVIKAPKVSCPQPATSSEGLQAMTDQQQQQQQWQH